MKWQTTVVALQLWAIEGLEAQITEKNSLLGYKKIRCLEIEKTMICLYTKMIKEPHAGSHYPVLQGMMHII